MDLLMDLSLRDGLYPRSPLTHPIHVSTIDMLRYLTTGAEADDISTMRISSDQRLLAYRLLLGHDTDP